MPDEGEVSELNPRGTGTLVVALKAVSVLLFNPAGHFMAGMWNPSEVTK